MKLTDLTIETKTLIGIVSVCLIFAGLYYNSTNQIQANSSSIGLHYESVNERLDGIEENQETMDRKQDGIIYYLLTGEKQYLEKALTE